MPRQTIDYYLKQLQALIGLILLLFLPFSTQATEAQTWRTLATGLEYLDLGEKIYTPWSHIHVFRIDLKHYQLDSVLATALSQPNASVDEFASHSKALLAINGGFFDHNYHPLGLRISQQQQYNPLKRISWWGIFYIEDQKPHLSSLRRFKNSKNIDFAIQSGPRILVNGKTPALKAGRDERSALGITEDGRIIILVTANAPLTTTDLAALMKSSPLNCHDALNLDGGSSSQLSARINSFEINVRGFSNISDAIIVKPVEIDRNSH